MMDGVNFFTQYTLLHEKYKDNIESIIFYFRFFGSHENPICLLVRFNLFVGYIEKYTFENQQYGGKIIWSIQPLNVIIAGKNVCAKIGYFCLHFGLNPIN